jgi:hypothetical protein
MKVPSKHGLERKFKPWRRGKSSKSNKRSSLKQQLRGQERLLAKISEPERRQELETKIASLKQEIEQKQNSLKEKKNAEKAHGQRFLDRQRLTRLERQVRKQLHDKKTTPAENERDLLKIALDQIYVAHHPNDVKYMPLFKQGKRVVDQSRQLYRRAVTRKRILREVTSDNSKRVPWIAKDQYERLAGNKEWTIQDEERIFGGTITRSKSSSSGTANKTEDSRFAMASEHEAMLKAAEQAESEILRQEEEQNENDGNEETSSKDDEDHVFEGNGAETEEKECDDTSSSSSSNDSNNQELEIDTLLHSHPVRNNHHEQEVDERSDSDSSSSTSDSSSSDDEEEGHDEAFSGHKRSSSTEHNEENSNVSHGGTNPDDKAEEVDDFLIDVNEEENRNVFHDATAQLPALSDARGDKSKGWQSQSQRPGEFKKKRIRRY